MSRQNISIRQKGRRIALQLLFEMEWMENRDVVSALEYLEYLLEDEGLPHNEDAVSFALKLVRGVEEFFDSIDSFIKKYAKNWRLERMNPIDRNIMRIAVFEIHFCPDIPGRVAVNEAVEMAKEFGGENAPAFVNGVLDSILKMNKDQ